ncbi:MAG: 4Fe-4S dicluster domain-containing protein [Nitrososphaerales archaeon]|jgi:anaerobic dimethyl sulfoxide reductase subunit B
MSSTTTTTTTSNTTYTTTTAPVKFQTGVQYGFFFDQSRCDGCNTCQVACKGWNVLVPGPAKMCRVLQWETGTFVNVRQNTLFAPCYHCSNPVCIPAAQGALIKEPNYGAVLIDPSQANSPNLKAAWEACPYGAISFDSDAPDSNAVKCTMCIDRLTQNQYPACVTSCTIRALDFDTMANLIKKYGSNTQMAGMPAPTPGPSIVFKPMNPRKSLVPYNENDALTLLGARPAPIPPVYTDPTNVTTVAAGVTQDHPIFHATSVAQFMVATTHQTD